MATVAALDESAGQHNRHYVLCRAMKIKIEVVERAGWWQAKVCGLRHSRYRSRAAAREISTNLGVLKSQLRPPLPFATVCIAMHRGATTVNP